MSELVQLEKASLYYDTGISLRNLNLRIDKDEFVYLFGPTGSGKTTLLRLMYMELVPNTGSVNVLGYDTSRLKRKRLGGMPWTPSERGRVCGQKTVLNNNKQEYT